MRAFFMRKLIFIIAVVLIVAGCKHHEAFNSTDFMQEAVKYHMLSQQEYELAMNDIGMIQHQNMRNVSYVCKKVNYATVIKDLGLDGTGADTLSNLAKNFKNQLGYRSEPDNPIGPVYLKGNMDSIKADALKFLKAVYDKDYISTGSYAKSVEKIKAEPVVEPFMVFELMETTP